MQIKEAGLPLGVHYIELLSQCILGIMVFFVIVVLLEPSVVIMTFHWGLQNVHGPQPQENHSQHHLQKSPLRKNQPHLVLQESLLRNNL